MKLADAGHTIALLTLTRGDAGLWLGKAFGMWSKADLGAERAKEWAAAVATIGYHWSRLLRYPDGGLKDAPADVLTADIVAAIREVRPEIVCTFGPEGAGSEHDDHRSASYFAARAFARAALADQYPERGDPHVARRLYPTVPPDMPYLCFYPMTKRRDAGQNWYTLTLDERSRLMLAHGQTGRRYAGRVLQIITGAIGFDAWEWGVTLFAKDPIDFKKLVTEMRFDEVSAKYAEFGEFFVGKLTPPSELFRS